MARLLMRTGRPGPGRGQQGRQRPAREPTSGSSSALGLGDPWPVSALHGRGTGDLLDEVVRRLPAGPDERDRASLDDGGADVGPDADAEATRVAIVGRPNVGKSTLFNRLIGDERSVVHDLPGTTRDAIDTVVETPDGPICFVDTAGMRRRSRTERGDRVLLHGAGAARPSTGPTSPCSSSTPPQGVTHQDQRLAERIGAAGSPIVVVLNKWDLVAADDRARWS